MDCNIETSQQTQENLVDKLDLREHLNIVEAEKKSDVTSYDPDCTECRTVHPDATPSELMMYLHALSYKVYSYRNGISVLVLGEWVKQFTFHLVCPPALPLGFVFVTPLMNLTLGSYPKANILK